MGENDPATAQAPVRQFLSNRLSTLATKLNRQANAILDYQAGIGLPEWRIIAMLAAQGPTAPSELSRITGMDLGLVSRTLKSLNQQELIRLQKLGDDRRRSSAELNAAGKRLFKKTSPVMKARQDSLVRALTKDEMKILYTVLDKLDRAAEIRDFGID